MIKTSLMLNGKQAIQKYGLIVQNGIINLYLLAFYGQLSKVALLKTEQLKKLSHASVGIF